MDLLQIDNWKTLIIFLLSMIFITAIITTIWKKNIRTHAKSVEIKIVAGALSIIITGSVAFGFQFPGLPLAIIFYLLIVYFGQWLISQKILDSLWKITKAIIKKKLDSDEVNEILK